MPGCVSNCWTPEPGVPFGGYKRSGNGREHAEFGLVEYLETHGATGYA
nr:aldehyde dehydrogenase family protein [Burkholderia ambifaria]